MVKKKKRGSTRRGVVVVLEIFGRERSDGKGRDK
jgi:hypothetical protein